MRAHETQKSETQKSETATLEFKEPAGPQDLTLLPSDLPHVEACAVFAAEWIERRHFRDHTLRRLAPWRSLCRWEGLTLLPLPGAPRELGGLLMMHRDLGWFIVYSARAGGRAKARAVCVGVASYCLVTSRDSPLASVPEERQRAVFGAVPPRVAGMLVGGTGGDSHAAA